MDLNSDINILGSLSDYNFVKLIISGLIDNHASEDAQIEYTNIKTIKSFKRFEKAINSTFNKFKSENLEDLIRCVFQSEDISYTTMLLLFWNGSLNNELIAYLNENVYFPALYSGRSIIMADEVLACISELKTKENALKSWAASTLSITASKYLTILKKMGFLEGTTKKKIIYHNLTDKEFVLFIYWLLEAEGMPNILDSKWLQYGFLEKKDFLTRVLQKKYMKYLSVAYNGDKLKIEPIILYKEIFYELG